MNGVERAESLLLMINSVALREKGKDAKVEEGDVGFVPIRASH